MRQLPKIFNTAGPIQADIHYNVEPLSRINLEEIEQLIDYRKYFILHAPRQTGKTSCLLALRDYLNARGEFIAVYANVEAGQAMRNQVDEVVTAFCYRIAAEADIILKSTLARDIYKQVTDAPASILITSFLTTLCEALDCPLVLFIDELHGHLRRNHQGRTPHPLRPHAGKVLGREAVAPNGGVCGEED